MKTALVLRICPDCKKEKYIRKYVTSKFCSSCKIKYNTSTYIHWRSIIRRCYDKSMVHYKNCGARGIIVCDRWKSSFLNFLTDMGKKPPNKTLERIDSDGNYELSNCRWSTPKEQENTKRNNFIIEAFGKKQTLEQWANEYNITCSLLYQRSTREKWPIEKALTYRRKDANIKKNSI